MSTDDAQDPTPPTTSSSDPVAAEAPAPDPGNAEPDQWTADLDDSEQDRAFDLVNSVAVDLPEPVLDDAASDGA